jgi:uncharacterized peroxidase-related enzyme
MSRIAPISPSAATGRTRDLLEAARSELGAVPNFLRVLAHSPQALEAFLAMYSALGKARIDLATRERIALAVAESNSCEYCVSAHCAIGRKAGLDGAEIALNRAGTSSDPRAAAAVALARALNEERGGVSDADLLAARAAGLMDEEIVEILALVVLNVFTNTVGKASQVAIDFPRVALLAARPAVA